MIPQGHDKRLPPLAPGPSTPVIGDSMAIPRQKKNSTACQPCKQAKRKVGSTIRYGQTFESLAKNPAKQRQCSAQEKPFGCLKTWLTFPLVSSSAVGHHHPVKLAGVAALNVFSTRVWTFDAEWPFDEPLPNSRIPGITIETRCIPCWRRFAPRSRIESISSWI